jgi:AcrR family transcriptional regulator
MSKGKEVRSARSKSAEGVKEERSALGRKRDQTLDIRIIEAAIEILAEVGFDTMTMDMVAARAKAGKATVYRRWASKAELVRDALIWMSRSSVDLDHLPDTGSLRSDLLAVMKPYSKDFGERKLRVLAGLGSFFSEHRKLAEEATAGIFDPWTEVNRSLMLRAIGRGELRPDADIDLACQVIVSITSYRSVTQNKPFNKASYEALLDNILLPALKSSGQSSRSGRETR